MRRRQKDLQDLEFERSVDPMRKCVNKNRSVNVEYAAGGMMVKEWRPTLAVASRAARMRISAQDTTPGQKCSRPALISSISATPLRPKFTWASLSAWLVAVEFKRTEPSQPWNHQINKITAAIEQHFVCTSKVRENILHAEHN